MHGNTRNPWSVARTPGGSSGGAAASVAAGVTPFALGTDGGGSVRAPAALTGLYGIKATFGRVPVWPASATPTLAHVGPLARTISDAELLLKVISGPDPRDQFSYLLPIEEAVDGAELRTLRIAFAPTMGYGYVDAPIAEAVNQAVSRLSNTFGNVEEVDVVCDEAAEIFVTEFMAGCAARLSAALKNARDDLDPVLRLGLERFRARTAQDVAETLRRRYQFKDQITAFFHKYDLLITPTAPCISWDAEKGVPPGHEHEAGTRHCTPRTQQQPLAAKVHARPRDSQSQPEQP
jgi:aspartyl-tRNA(Asn)/glutamyl-tRNA(Gln) amidotransferase subunit A